MSGSIQQTHAPNPLDRSIKRSIPAHLLTSKRRSRRERPCDWRAAEQRDELASFPLAEMHPIPHGPGAHRRISEVGPA